MLKILLGREGEICAKNAPPVETILFFIFEHLIQSLSSSFTNNLLATTRDIQMTSVKS